MKSISKATALQSLFVRARCEMSLLDEVDMKDVDTLLDDLFGGEASIQPQWNTTDLGDDTTQPPRAKRSRHEFDKSAPQMDDLLPTQTTSSSFIPNTDSAMFSLDQTFVPCRCYHPEIISKPSLQICHRTTSSPCHRFEYRSKQFANHPTTNQQRTGRHARTTGMSTCFPNRVC